MILRSRLVHNATVSLCHLVLFVPEESYGRKWRSQPVLLQCLTSHHHRQERTQQISTRYEDRELKINVPVFEVDNMSNISITTHGSSKTPDTPFPPGIHPSNRSTNAQFPNLLQDLLNPTIQLTLRILFSRIGI
jgi:hypothetical protein